MAAGNTNRRAAEWRSSRTAIHHEATNELALRGERRNESDWTRERVQPELFMPPFLSALNPFWYEQFASCTIKAFLSSIFTTIHLPNERRKKKARARESVK